MIHDRPHAALDALASAVAEERAHTVRVCFADHYGVLRGRRLAAERFVDGASTPQAFCDGALVWDIRCDIFEATAFSNFGTGYPDLHARPDLETLRPCGWVEGEYVVLADALDHHGEPIAVDPRGTLRRVAARAPQSTLVAAQLELRVPDEAVAAVWGAGHPAPFAGALLEGLRVAGLPVLAMQWARPERILTLTFGPAAPLAAADALVLARTAAREVAAAHGVRLTAMPRIAAGQRPAIMALTVDGARGTDLRSACARLDDLDLLLRPLPLAHPAAAAPTAAGEALRVPASSDANPYLAIAAALAAAWEPEAGAERAVAHGHRAAIERLRDARWAGEWFPPLLLHDALALAEREAALRDAAVTAWDLDRYWECG